MPQVPIYNDNQVRQQALPGVRVQEAGNLETFGGGSVLSRPEQALSGLNQQVTKLAEEETARANETRINEKRRLLNDWELQNVYDSKNGAIAKTGKNAFGVPQELEDSLKKFQDEQIKDLSTDAQRNAFQQLIDSRKGEVLKWANGHVRTNANAVEEAEYGAGIESSKERASADPKNVPLETAMIKQAILKRSQQMGWDAEQTKQELQKHESDLHSRAINTMLTNEQTDAAVQYLNNVSPNLDPDVKNKLVKEVEEGSVRKQSQQLSDQIASQTKSLSDAYEKTKDIQDSKVRDATVARLKDHFAMMKAAENEREERISKQAFDIIETNPSRDAIPPSVWQAMPLQARNAADARIRQLREGIPPTTDWNVYYDQKSIASSPATRDVFLKKNLTELRPKLADAEFKELVNLQTQLRKGDSEAEKTLNGYRSHSAVVDSTLSAAGIKPNDDFGTTDYKNSVKFRRLVDEEVLSLQSSTGRKATTGEVQQIADRLMIKRVTDKGMFWDTEQRSFELVTDDIKEIPLKARNNLQEYLKSKKIKVTDDLILRLYNERIKRGLE